MKGKKNYPSRNFLGDIAELKQIGLERESAAALEDVARWVKVAKETRTLADFSGRWDAVLDFFDEHGVEDEDLHLWRAYRNLILQRRMGMYNDILKLTDIIARDYYYEFFHSPLLKGMLKRYAADALPLTFLGHAEDYYYTYTHAHEHPIAVVSIPMSGTTSAWNWLALPHEIGHNIFDNVLGFERELARKIRDRLSRERFKIPGKRLPYSLPKSAVMEIIWTYWLDELMADVFGTLFAGPAYVMARQEDACNIASELGGPNITLWDVKGMEMMKHPVCHFRIIICCEVLRRIGFSEDAEMLDLRWAQMNRKISEYIWLDPSSNFRELFRIPYEELFRAMIIVLDVILTQKHRVINNHSLLEIVRYTPDEHSYVMKIERELTKMRPKIPAGSLPRMILAASRYAFEREPSLADRIHSNTEDAILNFEKNLLKKYPDLKKRRR